MVRIRFHPAESPRTIGSTAISERHRVSERSLYFICRAEECRESSTPGPPMTLGNAATVSVRKVALIL